MSERERWIVYPLLFLALGVALRDKLLHRIELLHHVESREIVCRDLRIVGDDGRIHMHLNSQGFAANDQTWMRIRAAKLEVAEVSAIDVVADNMAASRMHTSQLSINVPRSSEIVGQLEAAPLDDPDEGYRSELQVNFLVADEVVQPSPQEEQQIPPANPD